MSSKRSACKKKIWPRSDRDSPADGDNGCASLCGAATIWLTTRCLQRREFGGANEGANMRSLGDTIGRLAALRARTVGHQKVHAPDRLSDLSSFGSNPGALRARTYAPESLPAKAPLVVVLHGCTQTAADYDHGSGWSRLADRAGFALLFPEQQRSNNANLCFNWFLATADAIAARLFRSGRWSKRSSSSTA